MASRQGAKSKRSISKAAINSPSSSTAFSSKQFPENSVDGQSSPASSSVRSKPQYFYSECSPLGAERSKENVTVTVRFRPLSPREIRLGEEIAWYADGESIVRNEHNPSIAYAYDRVFGPTTTTRHVYDVAAQSVVSGAMEGINGTIFAYGVTSSGKTHTMHGDQRSPGIVPLTVKDVFSIIQETPNREFLLHVSYLEIYNEVINDLLNPVGQNLRIREDAQGTFVEGIKEEVVLSPAHALSLIAAGEEHRHVGSTNFNLHSSRSHTIFTLTVESSPCGANCEGEAVNLSQLHLIDLAGSESSKAETIGVRRREGSYINKSLLTLGTVISKLTDGRATHVPYRDSKLTRLLQSSLSGHGRVSLICTVTPSSSSTEESHNTLKFAHRAKHMEVQAAQNKIIDEKSLIKKYQNEIRCLKEELEQLRRGIVSVSQLHEAEEDDIELLKQKFEDGQVKLQSRLEEEEETKGALLARIQRLTKLILVSTKDTHSPRLPHHAGPRRRHSFGEEELAYLPHRKRDLILDDENIDVYVSGDENVETPDYTAKEDKKARKNGLLNWLKPRKRDSGVGTLASASDKSSGVKSVSTPSTPKAESVNLPSESCLSNSHHTESVAADPLEARLHSPDDTPATSITSIDVLREQQKILSGEVSLHFSALKRLSVDASSNPEKDYVHEEIKELNDKIKRKNDQIAFLEKQIVDSMITCHDKVENVEAALTVADLMPQLNDMSFELEVKVADNRVIQDQLDQKIHECKEMQDTVASLKEQLSNAMEFKNTSAVNISRRLYEVKAMQGELCMYEKGAAVKDSNAAMLLQAKAKEIEELKQKVTEVTEAKEQLELRNQKLAEESSYAKGLASAAAVELKALSEEIAKLMTHNEKLTAQLATIQKSSSSQQQRKTISTPRNIRRLDNNKNHVKRQEPVVLSPEVKRELAMSRERELSYEAALAEKEQREGELHRKLEESKQKEAYLENELANMWVLVAKLKKTHGAETDVTDPLQLWN